MPIPNGQGVFTQLVQQAGLSKQIQIDSAGTHDYNIGNPPDLRSQQAAHQRGIDLSKQRARQVRVADLLEFDYVLAMDKYNYQILDSNCPLEHEHKLHLLLDFAPELSTQEVPDPYKGGDNGFEQVLDLIETACKGLLNEIRQQF